MLSQVMQAFLIEFFLRLIAIFPLSWLKRIGQLGGQILFLLPNEVKRITTINIQHCYSNDSHEKQQQLVNASLIETAVSYAQISALWFKKNDI